MFNGVGEGWVVIGWNRLVKLRFIDKVISSKDLRKVREVIFGKRFKVEGRVSVKVWSAECALFV